MATIFPLSPDLNDTFESDGTTWKWNGSAWEFFSGPGSTVIGGGGAAVEYSDTQPDTSSLDEGTLWIDSDEDISNGLLVSTFNRWIKVLSASATVLSGLDDDELSLLYTPGFEQVYVNGTLLVRGDDYTATDGTSVTLTTAAENGDVVEIHIFESFSIADTYTKEQIDDRFNHYTRWSKTYSASATVISGEDDYGNALNYTNNYERVFINGVLVDPTEYTRTSASVITPDESILSGDVVEVFNIEAAQIGDTYTTAQIDAKYNNRTRWTKTFSASATVLSGADDNAITLDYDSGYEEVYLNGILLIPTTDYTRTDSSTITLAEAVVSGDIIDVVNVSPFNLVSTYSSSQIDDKYNNYTRWTKTLAASATLIEGNDDNSVPLSYTPGAEQVYVNGSLIMRDEEYTASSGSTIVLSEAGVTDDVIDVISFTPFNVTNVYTKPEVDSAFAPVNAGGTVLLNKTEFSAASTVSINNVFSSEYTNYLVLTNFVGTSSVNLDFKLRASGTDDSTSNSYIAQHFNLDNASVGATRITSTSARIASYSTENNGNELLLYKPFLAERTSWFSKTVSSESGARLHLHTATHNQSTSYDGFSLIPSSGTITGTLRIYGYKDEVE